MYLLLIFLVFTNMAVIAQKIIKAEFKASENLEGAELFLGDQGSSYGALTTSDTINVDAEAGDVFIARQYGRELHRWVVEKYKMRQVFILPSIQELLNAQYERYTREQQQQKEEL